MIKSSVKLLISLYVVSLMFACSSANNKPLLIAFNSDSSAIVFNHIAQSGLLELQKMQKDSALNELAAVLLTPSEMYPTIKEVPLAGSFKVTDSNLVFIPSYPFIKGRNYLVITHLNVRFGNAADLLKGDLANRVRPQQKMLTR